ncbi:competence/damage-inducible protein A [Planctomycetota bacterium]
MKKAGIITVGNELLSGYTVDTNAAYLGRHLWDLGVPLTMTLTVPDEIETIVTALERASSDADLILVTGGLGPTDDDLTRYGLARFLGVDLYSEEKYISHVRQFFAQRGVDMPERNVIQAQFPLGTTGIDNLHGTAPGILARQGDTVIVAMPGVPSEMKAMFETAVMPLARELAGNGHVTIKRLRCFGVGESMLVERLGDRMVRGRNPLINCTVDHGLITLHVIAHAQKKEQADRLVDADVATLRAELGNLVFGQDNQTLAEVIGKSLRRQGKTVATAESCTGGLIAKLLTDCPGASDYFNQGWITYSNDAKVRLLDVPLEMLENHGAVSEPVAAALAQSAQRIAGADYALAVTGIAGPGGGALDKPVGLVFIGLCTPKECRVERFQFARDRSFVRFRTAQTALNLLRQALLF